MTNPKYTVEVEMVIEYPDGAIMSPIVDGLSSHALDILNSYNTKERSWARDDLPIAHVHELLAISFNPGLAKSVLVITFENGERDFFVSVNEFKGSYDWAIINNDIDKQPYQEIVAPERLAEMDAKYLDLNNSD
jgi:hypothetical protein